MSRLILAGLLLVCLYTDIKEKQVLIYPIAIWGIFGIFYCAIFEGRMFPDIAAGMAVGGSILLLSRISREAIGYGDGILLVVTGIYLGGWKNLELLMGALLLAAVTGIVLIIAGKWGRKDRIPFTPFLCLSYLGVVFL